MPSVAERSQHEDGSNVHAQAAGAIFMATDGAGGGWPIGRGGGVGTSAA